MRRYRTRACSAPPSASDNRIARSTSAGAAGSRMHSSSCIAMSAPSRFWISIARSGVSVCGAAVEMRAKGHPVVVDAAQRRERHDLEAARVGEDRVPPVHEHVQAAEPRNALGARAQHQVVGIASRMSAPDARTASGSMPFTVAWVPIGMNAGVRTTPCGVAISPTRAAPSVARRRKEKVDSSERNLACPARDAARPGHAYQSCARNSKQASPYE